MSIEKELKLIIQAAREFSVKQLAPEREENDKYPFGSFFSHVVEKAFDLDLFHLLLPGEFDGLDLGLTALSAVLENLCREDSSLAGIIFTTVAAQEILRLAGAEKELKKISNRGAWADFLLAMPVFDNPSEVNRFAAVRSENERYFLSGRIDYLVLGNLAAHALIPAKAGASSGYGYFLLDLKANGIKLSEPVLSLGLHACPAVDLELNQAPALLIGEMGAGERYFTQMADRMHVAAAAMALGIMKGSFKEALDYAKNREQGGQEIINWSEVKMMLADMAVQISTAEMIVAQAAQSADEQTAKWQARSRAAALHVQQMACELTTNGIQIMGGVGYMKDFGQEKRFRDAKHLQALLGMAPLKKLAFLQNMI